MVHPPWSLNRHPWVITVILSCAPSASFSSPKTSLGTGVPPQLLAFGETSSASGAPASGYNCLSSLVPPEAPREPSSQTKGMIVCGPSHPPPDDNCVALQKFVTCPSFGISCLPNVSPVSHCGSGPRILFVLRGLNIGISCLSMPHPSHPCPQTE